MGEEEIEGRCAGADREGEAGGGGEFLGGARGGGEDFGEDREGVGELAWMMMGGVSVVFVFGSCVCEVG